MLMLNLIPLDSNHTCAMDRIAKSIVRIIKDPSFNPSFPASR